VGNLKSDVKIVEIYFLSDNGFKKSLDDGWHKRFDNFTAILDGGFCANAFLSNFTPTSVESF